GIAFRQFISCAWHCGENLNRKTGEQGNSESKQGEGENRRKRGGLWQDRGYVEHNSCVPSPDGLSVTFGSLPVGQTERQPSQKFERRKAEPAQQNGRTPSPTVQGRARGF